LNIVDGYQLPAGRGHQPQHVGDRQADQTGLG
jgi:hypothetical protein